MLPSFEELIICCYGVEFVNLCGKSSCISAFVLSKNGQGTENINHFVFLSLIMVKMVISREEC